MTNNELERLSGLYIQHDISFRYGYTFDQFINSYFAGYVDLEGDINERSVPIKRRTGMIVSV